MINSNFENKRKHLKTLTDDQLHAYFWELTSKIVDPLIELAKTHTSPSIERSVLLRMGFTSIESSNLVEKCIHNNLISHGAGNIVLRYAQVNNISIQEAGNKLITEDDWNIVLKLFL
jgi:D-ornithine 4,5-aminomutase subunit alpha